MTETVTKQAGARRDIAYRIIARTCENPDDTFNPQTRGAYGRLSSITCIVLNILLSLVKGLAGILSGSLSVVADAVNNLTDASSNIVSLIGFKLASRPADEGHPYGHGRYEYLAGMVIAVLVVSVGVELGRSSIDRIMKPEPQDFGLLAVGSLVISMAVKLWMAVFNHRLAQRINSGVLEATSVDSRNDIIATGAVLIAGFVGKAMGLELDGWAGLGVAIFIAVSGVGLLKDTVDPLLGGTPSEELVQHVYDTIMSYPGVLGTHDLMIHDYGPGRHFASAHVETAADTTVRQSHKVLDKIEHHLLKHDNLPIVLHCDPIETEEGNANLRNWLTVRLRQIDRRISVHDVKVSHPKVITSPTGAELITRVRLDCQRPDDLGIEDKELTNIVTEAVRQRIPDAVVQITMDKGYVSSI